MIDDLWEFLWVAAHALFQRLPFIDAQNLFLPRGTGPSILIVGGLTMLALSLYLSLKIPNTTPASARPGSGGGQDGRGSRFTLPVRGEREPACVAAVMRKAEEEGLEMPHRVTAASRREGVAFARCPSYRFATEEHRGWERVRRILARGVEGDPGVKVEIEACHPWEERACVFEIVEEGSS